jgi:hypothetical protein
MVIEILSPIPRNLYLFLYIEQTNKTALNLSMYLISVHTKCQPRVSLDNVAELKLKSRPIGSTMLPNSR